MEEHTCCAAKREGHAQQSPRRSKPVEVKESPYKARDTEQMVYIPGGSFLMGTNEPEANKLDGEGPIRKMTVDSFYMDQTAVTNQEFREFIEDTNYVTEAEQYGWSFVFHTFLSDKVKQKVTQYPKQTPWWLVVEGATWEHPEGVDSSVEERLDHPVIHVSWHDAQQYCRWAGKRLPTETEWEYAARGGLEQKKYVWGNELTPNNQHQCNIWQGSFPNNNTMEDGYIGTAPAESYTKNGYGLYNMAGNVWEWCTDWFAVNIHKRGGKVNPTGASSGTSRVMRGGSYLCHDSYCNRYRVAARTSNTPDSSSGNIGFRCVKDA